VAYDPPRGVRGVCTSSTVALKISHQAKHFLNFGTENKAEIEFSKELCRFLFDYYYLILSSLFG
jgi:hypothetical protein